jgi:hypothetical protein
LISLVVCLVGFILEDGLVKNGFSMSCNGLILSYRLPRVLLIESRIILLVVGVFVIEGGWGGGGGGG